MAKYTITYRCGHETEVALFGKRAARETRIAAMERDTCPACRAKGSNLQGCEKQIAWAEDIRAEMAPKIIARHDAMAATVAAAPARPDVPAFEDMRAAILTGLEQTRDSLLARTSAKDWIDSRTDDGEVAYTNVIRSVTTK